MLRIALWAGQNVVNSRNVIRNFFCPAFAAAPRHPWRGKIIVFEIMKTIKLFKKIQSRKH
jgi:hypothetical protein